MTRYARRPWRPVVPLVFAVVLTALLAAPVHGHERREVTGGYLMIVGFIEEPVFAGTESGLEFAVMRGEEPVEGLEEALTAEVSKDGETRQLPLSPRFGQPGWYQSHFFPTAAGPYTFRIQGMIGETQIDETFTSSEEGFNEVEEAVPGQFPDQFPTTADLAAQAQQGAAAAGQVGIALALGGLALIAAMIALGLVLARWRRT